MPGFDLTALNAALGAYHRTHADELYSNLIERDHELKLFRTIAGIKDEYVATETQITELIQAYQKAWTPKGTISFLPEILKIRRVKVDLELDPVDLEKTFIGAKIDGSLPEGQDFIEGYIFAQMMKRIRKDLRKTLMIGQYVAPTPGTAGAAINAFTGLRGQYLAAVTALKVNNIVATGVITTANVREKVEEIFDSIDEDFKEENLVMLMSSTLLRWYKRDYRSEFGSNGDYPGISKEMVPVTIDGTNTEIVGVPAWNGYSTILVTAKENLVRLIDGTGEDDDFNLRFQVDKRIILVLGDFKMGVGFPIIKGLVWGNDETPIV